MRRPLHRLLFIWFGAAIVLTACTVGLVFRAAGHGPGAWQDHEERIERFVSGRFERTWDDPAAREELARSIAADLGMGVEIADADGQALGVYGPTCSPHRTHSVTVRRGTAELGVVRACAPEAPWGDGWVFVLGIVAAAVVLWGMAGMVARRLTRPFRELVRVARELGDGNLSARVRLGHHHGGEVGLLAGSFNDMAMRIEKQMADQRELLAAVSHEIRTPLGHMRVLADMARDRGADPATMDELDRELSEADGLVDELLASSRLEFAALATQRLSAAEVARRALARAGTDEDVLEADDVDIEADPTLLARAFANLLANARKHGGGVARVCVKGTRDRVRFEVHDEGPGFASDDLSLVFDPFYRGAEGQGRAGSSLGLGLSLVARIARAHGGRAFAENASTGGAVVGFEVARVPPARPAP